MTAGAPDNASTPLACRCGTVRLAVRGSPIIAAECHCTSCRAAAGRLAALPGAADVRAANGGVRCVLWRKDRVRFLAGAERLQEFRLTPASKTRRVVAGCCGTPVFTEFERGHWLSLFSSLWPRETRPAPDLRTMTSDLAPGTALPDDMPNCRHQSVGFFAKLLSAWVAMGFRVPKVTVAGGTLDA
jgi:hypothetical protein